VIDQAVRIGLDPYLALSVVLIENTQGLIEENNAYADRYGLIPANPDWLKKALQYPRNDDESGTLRILLDGKRSPHTARLCAEWTNTFQFYNCQENPKTCEDNANCFEVSPANRATKENIYDHFGVQFLKSVVQDHISREQPLIESIQIYNGTHCYDPHHEKPNACFNGLWLGDRPVYGARVADLMLTTLLPNDDIAQLVKDRLKAHNEKLTSAFCLEKGAGDHALNLNTYNQLQRQYLLGGQYLRSGQPPYKACKMHKNMATPLLPAVDDFTNKYIAIEKARARACETLFNSTGDQDPRTTTPPGAKK
jgi:hypothetical protein